MSRLTKLKSVIFPVLVLLALACASTDHSLSCEAKSPRHPLTKGDFSSWPTAGNIWQIMRWSVEGTAGRACP